MLSLAKLTIAGDAASVAAAMLHLLSGGRGASTLLCQTKAPKPVMALPTIRFCI